MTAEWLEADASRNLLRKSFINAFIRTPGIGAVKYNREARIGSVIGPAQVMVMNLQHMLKNGKLSYIITYQSQINTAH